MLIFRVQAIELDVQAYHFSLKLVVTVLEALVVQASLVGASSLVRQAWSTDWRYAIALHTTHGVS